MPAPVRLYPSRRDRVLEWARMAPLLIDFARHSVAFVPWWRVTPS